MSDARTNISLCRRRVPSSTPSPRTLFVYFYLIFLCCLSHHTYRNIAYREKKSAGCIGLGEIDEADPFAVEYESQSKIKLLHTGVIIFARWYPSFFLSDGVCQWTCWVPYNASARRVQRLSTDEPQRPLFESVNIVYSRFERKGKGTGDGKIPICYQPNFVYSDAWKTNVANTRRDDEVTDTARDQRPRKTRREFQHQDFSKLVANHVRK